MVNQQSPGSVLLTRFIKDFRKVRFNGKKGWWVEMSATPILETNKHKIVMTQNNSISMKTVVETFIIEETQELIYDNEKLDKWNELVLELQLQGQAKVVKTEKSPIPFLWMNEVLVRVFEELCPRKVLVQEYDKTPIPVEALSLVALSAKETYFDKIEVWYNDKSPDPAIVGYKYIKFGSEWERNYYAEKYLLARWADVKASLSQLTDRAKDLFMKRRTNEINESIKIQQRQLEDLRLTCDQEFGLVPNTIQDLPF